MPAPINTGTRVITIRSMSPAARNHKGEWFYLLDGEVTFHFGGENRRATGRAFVSYPRGTAHTFTIESPTARFLVINTPGGFEHLFELAPRTPEDAGRALAAYGIEVVGPHPRQAVAA
jgi:quercetin dioxygenase-like cupin family protein